ncbi:MAG TPA: iron-sulfur cluster assembly scaffold protein [Planctomycetes bacterium]|nr:iron-sulfur cluster assembly scaffold protein [Planctomycetota bacterium]
MHPDLKAHVLDPKGVGSLDAPDAEAQGDNQVCGDSLRIQLQIQKGNIRALRWKAKACPSTLALASLAFLCYEGAALPSGPPFEALRASLAQHGGLRSYESHALHLVEETLAKALASLP